MVQALPGRARVVVIGGGVGGTSVAFHLAERGERDVLLVERAELTSGSTFHSAGPGRAAAEPACRRISSRRAGEDASRSDPDSTHPGACSLSCSLR